MMRAGCCHLLSSLLALSAQSASTSDAIRDSYQGQVRWAQSGPYGSAGGPRVEPFTDWWDSLDGTIYFPTHDPDQINIRAGGSIDSIQMFYGGKPGGHHGGLGGHLHRLRLFSGDRIVRVTGRAGLGPGAGVDQLTVHTSNGRVLGPFGGTGGVAFDTGDWSRSGCSLGFISGWADQRLDSIVFHWRCPRGPQQFSDLDEHESEARGNAHRQKPGLFSVTVMPLLLLAMQTRARILGLVQQ